MSASLFTVQATRSCSSTCRCSTSSCPLRASTCARYLTTSTPRLSWAPCKTCRTQQSGSSTREYQLCRWLFRVCTASSHKQLSCLMLTPCMLDTTVLQTSQLPCSALSECWGTCRYLNIRMLRNPTLYGVPLGQIDADPLLKVCPVPTTDCSVPNTNMKRLAPCRAGILAVPSQHAGGDVALWCSSPREFAVKHSLHVSAGPAHGPGAHGGCAAGQAQPGKV